MPTAIWRLQLRSGIWHTLRSETAHCHLAEKAICKNLRTLHLTGGEKRTLRPWHLPKGPSQIVEAHLDHVGLRDVDLSSKTVRVCSEQHVERSPRCVDLRFSGSSSEDGAVYPLVLGLPIHTHLSKRTAKCMV